MSTHYIDFYDDLTNIIFELSSCTLYLLLVEVKGIGLQRLSLISEERVWRD